jgi:mannose-6-phosphate isomerase-like protein (cupin superfamily)
MTSQAIETIKHDEDILGLLLRSSYSSSGINFFTPDEFSQQLAYMNRPAGYVIQPHVHNPVKREVHYTNEVLFIRSGRVRVDFYDEDKNYLESRILMAGDVLLLVHGGHGFEMLEDSEIIEVKQGPYAGEADKTRFSPVALNQVQIKNNNEGQ